MADVSYTDRNGVKWLILESNGRFFGTADPGSPRRYEPLQPDTAITNAEGAAASEIEKYASAHKRDVTLVVTAARDTGAWVVLLVLAAVVLSES
jgi:hypothetical protein